MKAFCTVNKRLVHRTLDIRELAARSGVCSVYVLISHSSACTCIHCKGGATRSSSTESCVILGTAHRVHILCHTCTCLCFSGCAAYLGLVQL